MAFQLRNSEIVLRTPEPTSVARARGFNKTQVTRFYNILEVELEKHSIGPDTLYNMDETGIMTTTNKPPKVLSISGKKQVGVISSTERGKLTTVICCCNATGFFIPPFMIFARKRMQERLLDGSPPGTQATCTPNGWTNGETFLLWFKFFVEHVRPSATKNVLLVLDNHESHKYYPALEYASKNHVTFVSVPPHTTHRLQPLDVAVYGPIKKYFEQEINTFQKQHPGRIVNQYDVAKLFCGAYLKGANPCNGVKGFTSTGIWPFNKNLFNEDDFAPSNATDQHSNETPVSSTHPANTRLNKDLPLVLEAAPDLPNTRPLQPNTSLNIDAIPGPSNTRRLQPNTSLNIDDIPEPSNTRPHQPDSSLNIDAIPKPSNAKCSYVRQIADDWSSSDDEPLVQLCKTNLLNRQYESPVKVTLSCKDDIPETISASKQNLENNNCTQAVTYFTPEVIRPLPTVFPKKNVRKRKLGKAEVLTSTTIKTEQLQKFRDAKTKSVKLEVKRKNAYKNKKQYYCQICGELYLEVDGKPTENWIMCSVCQEWSHEACTSYDGQDTYTCDCCD